MTNSNISGQGQFLCQQSCHIHKLFLNWGFFFNSNPLLLIINVTFRMLTPLRLSLKSFLQRLKKAAGSCYSNYEPTPPLITSLQMKMALKYWLRVKKALPKCPSRNAKMSVDGAFHPLPFFSIFFCCNLMWHTHLVNVNRWNHKSTIWHCTSSCIWTW